MSDAAGTGIVERVGKGEIDPVSGCRQHYDYARIEDAPVLHRHICMSAIDALTTPTHAQIARWVGCSQHTVNAVLNYSVCREHIANCRERQRLEMLQMAEEAKKLVPKAVKTLSDCMEANIPPSVRVSAANSVLDRDPDRRFIRESRSNSINLNGNLGPVDSTQDAIAQARKNHEKRRKEAIDVDAAEVAPT